MKNYNEGLEKVLTAVFGGFGILAIFINLHLKGYDYENWLDAIKDIAGLIVVLAVFIASSRLGSRSKTYTEVAKSALEKLQKRYADILMGPRYNRDGYDPEKGQGLEYLFITNDDPKSKLRAKFIPIQPLSEGVLVIYVQKGTLVYGLDYTSEHATPEEIKKIQLSVADAVKTLIQNKYSGYYEDVPDKKDDTAIIIDFDEQKMGKKKFARAVFECSETALQIIRKHKKQ